MEVCNTRKEWSVHVQDLILSVTKLAAFFPAGVNKRKFNPNRIATIRQGKSIWPAPSTTRRLSCAQMSAAVSSASKCAYVHKNDSYHYGVC